MKEEVEVKSDHKGKEEKESDWTKRVLEAIKRKANEQGMDINLDQISQGLKKARCTTQAHFKFMFSEGNYNSLFQASLAGLLPIPPDVMMMLKSMYLMLSGTHTLKITDIHIHVLSQSECSRISSLKTKNRAQSR